MLLTGGLLATQSQINGRLATHLGSGLRAGIAAAVISLTTGLLILLPVSAVVPGYRRRLIALTRAIRERRLRPWEISGPLLGAGLVASQGLTSRSRSSAVWWGACPHRRASTSMSVLSSRPAVHPASRRTRRARAAGPGALRQEPERRCSAATTASPNTAASDGPCSTNTTSPPATTPWA
ncbi:DMT family transporter [Streptomyces sp. NPDC060001]